MRSPKRVRLLRTAEDDLNDIVMYVAADKPGAAAALADKLEAGLAVLSRHPFSGRVPRDGHLADLGYRYLILEGFLVFYTVEPDAVLVHRLLHGERDYARLL